jgi:hypothetical protein
MTMGLRPVRCEEYGEVGNVFCTLETQDMQTSIDMPQSFSVRDENEFFPIQHLMSRLNPKLTVSRVATGRHVHGGPTVVWGLVHLEGKKPSKKEVENEASSPALAERSRQAIRAATAVGLALTSAASGLFAAETH